MKKKTKNIIIIVAVLGVAGALLTLLFVKPASETTETIEEGATTTEKKGILSIVAGFFNPLSSRNER